MYNVVVILNLEVINLSNSEEKCTVVEREVSLEDISSMLDTQSNIFTPNARKGNEDAFTKTLRGSKIYLKELGL